MEEKEFNITDIVAPTEAIIEDEEVTANEMKQIIEDNMEEKGEE